MAKKNLTESGATQVLAALPKKSFVSASFEKLAGEVKEVLQAGRERAREAVKKEELRTYWEVGRLIEHHVQALGKTPKGRAAYGRGVIKKLAQRLGENPSYLYMGWELARTYPNFGPVQNLPPSHVRKLLTVNDPVLRGKLTRQMTKNHWSRRKLEEEIKTLKAKQGSPKIQKLFRPKKGRPHFFRIVSLPAFGKQLFLDLGFSLYLPVPEKFLKDLQANDIVEALSLDQIQKKPEAVNTDLFMYPVTLERVVDGDTLRVVIEILGTVVRKKLRLRAIDTPELATLAGKKVKAFVEKQLNKKAPCFIQTTRPDKYDRYLSDVWLGETNLNQLLLDRGLAEIKTSYSSADWDV